MNLTQSILVPSIMAAMLTFSSTGAIQQIEPIPLSYIETPEETDSFINSAYSYLPQQYQAVDFISLFGGMRSANDEEKKAFASALAKLSKPVPSTIFELL